MSALEISRYLMLSYLYLYINAIIAIIPTSYHNFERQLNIGTTLAMDAKFCWAEEIVTWPLPPLLSRHIAVMNKQVLAYDLCRKVCLVLYFLFFGFVSMFSLPSLQLPSRTCNPVLTQSTF